MKYVRERINCGRFATRTFDKSPTMPELGRGQKMIVWVDSVPRPRDSKEDKLVSLRAGNVARRDNIETTIICCAALTGTCHRSDDRTVYPHG